MEEDCEKPKAFADGSPGPGGGGCTGSDEEHTTVSQRATWSAGAEQVWHTHKCRAAVERLSHMALLDRYGDASGKVAEWR